LRTFIAIELEDAVKQALSRTIGELAGLDRRVKWVERENLHVTVKFLGDIDDNVVPHVLDAMCDVCKDFEPFEFTVTGLGAFPNLSRPRVVWAGCEGPPGVAEKLGRRIDLETRFAGTKVDRRRFVPHVTLGRVRGRNALPSPALGRAIEEASTAVWGSTEVTAATFFMSELSRSGPTYTVLGRAPLGSSG
jgi:2'-5' RNA ligase